MFGKKRLRKHIEYLRKALKDRQDQLDRLNNTQRWTKEMLKGIEVENKCIGLFNMPKTTHELSSKYAQYNITELNEMLENRIELEHFEEAGEIQNELNSREKTKNT